MSEAEQADLRPAHPAWTLADLGAFVLFAAFALPAAFLGTAIAFVGLRQVFGWELSVEEAFMRAPVIVLMQTSWEVLWLAFIYFTVAVKYRRAFWEALRWTSGAGGEIHPALRPRNWIAAGALLALAAQLYFYAAPTENELPIEQLFASPGAGYVLAFFGIFVAPFVEEIVFRGFFYPVFEQKWGLWAAVLLTAVLFAVIHASQLWGGWEEITVIFVVGTAFSYARGKTGSLAPSYLMHLGYNTALFVALYISTDGFRTLSG
jgi:membrane protease YdiL (CAAX protease family)